MTKPFSHTGAGFALPHLHVDPQGWNLEGPNAAIQAFHSFRAGVGRLRNDREIIQTGNIRNFRNARPYPVAASGHSGHLVLKSGEACPFSIFLTL